MSCDPQQRGWVKKDSHGRASAKFDVILDVSPAAAPPFRAATVEWFSEMRFPDAGATLSVRCNPEKQAVEINLSEDARFNPKIFRRANEEQRKQEHDRILNAPPGTPAAGGDSAIEDPDLAALARFETELRGAGIEPDGPKRDGGQ